MSLSKAFLTMAAMVLAATTVDAMPSRTTCKYRGNVFANNERVVGETLTCTCSMGKWIDCQADNAGSFGTDDLNMISNDREFAAEMPSRGENSGALEEGEAPFPAVNGLEIGANAFLNNFEAEDFVIDFATLPVESTGLGGTVQPASRNNVPVMQASNMAQTRFRIAPCGINLPHVHPRGTESVYMIEGELQVGFVTESGRLLLNNVVADQSTFFPQGLLHYQQNLMCEPAGFISILDSSDPGLLVIPAALANLPSEAIEATFDEDAAFVRQLRLGLPAGPARGRAECLRRCGLPLDTPL